MSNVMGNKEGFIIVKPPKRWVRHCKNPKCYICNPTEEMKTASMNSYNLAIDDCRKVLDIPEERWREEYND